MKKKILALTAATLAGGLMALLPAQAQSPLVPVNKKCPNTIVREPVLVYSLQGGTLLGAVQETLVVYSDGSAQMTCLEPNATLRVESASLSPQDVANLEEQLSLMNADELCDSSQFVFDVPLATLTYFPRSGTDAKAHTYSYYPVAGGNWIAVDDYVQSFMSFHFPKPIDSGGTVGGGAGSGGGTTAY